MLGHVISSSSTSLFTLPSMPRSAKSFFFPFKFSELNLVCISYLSVIAACLSDLILLGLILLIFFVRHRFRFRFNKSLQRHCVRGHNLWPPLLQGAVGWGGGYDKLMCDNRIKHSALGEREARLSWCVSATFEGSQMLVQEGGVG
jgi:hypothetical protein